MYYQAYAGMPACLCPGNLINGDKHGLNCNTFGANNSIKHEHIFQ